MTTVGYGDIAPKTAEGKVITICVMLVGIGFATLLIGSIAERFINCPAQEPGPTDGDVLEAFQEVSARLKRLERALEQQRHSG